MPLVHHDTKTAGEAVVYPARPREVRVCEHNGCGTHLSAYNPGEFCCLHERIHRSGEASSACRSAAPTAATPPRKVKEGNVSPNTQERQRRVLQALADGEWHRGPQLMQATGMTHQTAKKTLTEMAHAGLIESGGKGGKGFRLPQTPAPATPPAPAPATSLEQPADPSPPSPSTPEAATGAGTTSTAAESITVDWFVPRTVRSRLSVVGVLAAIDDLEAEERARCVSCVEMLWGCGDVKGAGQ